MEGRVAAAPGWVRVDPPAFSTRKRQSLTLTALTEGVWSTPVAYSETVVLETSGGRQEIAVAASILPARLSWGRIALWYVPLLISAGLPAVTALFSQFHGTRFLFGPGFVASGLLFLSVFVLTLAADVTWPPRLLPLGLAALDVWGVVNRFGRLSSGGSARAHLALVQTVTPVLVLLILQSCAFALGRAGLGPVAALALDHRGHGPVGGLFAAAAGVGGNVWNPLSGPRRPRRNRLGKTRR